MYRSIENIGDAQIIYIPNFQIYIYYIFKISSLLKKNYIYKFFI